MFQDANYYTYLQVDRNAEKDVIAWAYKKLALKYHPDNNPGDRQAEEKLKQITEAYAVISDPEKRAQYDKWLSEMESSSDNSAHQEGQSAASKQEGQSSPGTELYVDEAAIYASADAKYNEWKDSIRKKDEAKQRARVVATILVILLIIACIAAGYIFRSQIIYFVNNVVSGFGKYYRHGIG